MLESDDHLQTAVSVVSDLQDRQKRLLVDDALLDSFIKSNSLKCHHISFSDKSMNTPQMRAAIG